VNGWVWVCLALTAAGIYYAHDVYRHPWRKPCPRCEGSGRHSSSLIEGMYGKCWRCKGKPQRPRWAIRIFRPDMARQMQAGMHGKWY
jgi:hypothetical protein